MRRKVRGGADSGVLWVDDEQDETQRGAAWSPQTVNAHLGDTPLGPSRCLDPTFGGTDEGKEKQRCSG